MSNPGTLGSLTNSPLIDDGTLVRNASQSPGTVGKDERARAESLALTLETTKGFSDHALERMKYLESPVHATDMVGSQSGTAKAPEFVTDCITFVIRVLSYAFDKTNDPIASNKVRSLGTKGTDLAKYLVNRGWTAAFCNPDVNHPADGDEEHIAAYHSVTKHKTYYGIPVKYAVINYNPAAKSNPNYKDHWGMSKQETKKDVTLLSTLKKVKFAYGLSRGGKHTWLLSYGRVYEVHWDQVGSSLYGNTPLETFEWLSSVVVFPPDAAAERLQDLF